MTTIQLNAEVLRNLSVVAEDENLLKRVAKYLRKLVAEKENSTQMTKEEFYGWSEVKGLTNKANATKCFQVKI